jgi:hypothetical protein
MKDACPYTVAVGGYVLGVLRAQESNEFREHAATCVHCEREILELNPVARLLETLKVVASTGECPQKSPLLWGSRAGMGAMTSQCSTILPSATRKRSQ